MNVITNLLLETKRMTAELNKGTIDRKNAVIKIKFPPEKEKEEKEFRTIQAVFEECVDHGWTFYDNGELDAFEDLEGKYTFYLVPSYYISKQSRDAIKKMVNELYPAFSKDQKRDAWETLMEACDTSRDEFDLTLGDVVGWLEGHTWGELVITDEKFKEVYPYFLSISV